MSEQPVLAHADVVAMLAELADRPADQVPEWLGSLELAWLVHRVEQRCGRRLDLDDEQLAGVRTVSDAVRVLGNSMVATADG